MVDACPITGDQVDEGAGRIAAFFSLLVMALGAGFGWIWAVLALSVDFALRAAGQRRFSPLARLARLLRQLAGIKPRMVNAGPKRFAALIGVLFSVGVGSAQILHLRLLSLLVAGVLVGCAGLEAFFGYCVACRLYPYLRFLRREETI
jgi:hypothetical protein